MENKFKYRPEVKSIEDLQPGDEFLVGDERWRYTGTEGTELVCNDARGFIGGSLGKVAVNNLIRANVPIERDIPYPEGGAEKWELREGDDETRTPKGTLHWWEGEWVDDAIHVLARNHIYAIPKAKPQDKAKPAPKVYTVANVEPGNSYVSVGFDFQPGDKVTVERVMR
jgi:hypothetical protein